VMEVEVGIPRTAIVAPRGWAVGKSTVSIRASVSKSIKGTNQG
jgi:hypothetical protein